MRFMSVVLIFVLLHLYFIEINEVVSTLCFSHSKVKVEHQSRNTKLNLHKQFSDFDFFCQCC